MESELKYYKDKKVKARVQNKQQIRKVIQQHNILRNKENQISEKKKIKENLPHCLKKTLCLVFHSLSILAF